MEKQEKKSKKEIWKEISLDFWALCRELRLWWFPSKVEVDQTDESERETLKKEVDGTEVDGTAKSEEKPFPKEVKVQKKKVGMFYYAEDKSFSEELIPNKTVSGVVYHVDETGEHGLVVLLHQKELPWLSLCLCVGLSDELNGKENTCLILEFAEKLGLSADAAEYCVNYAYDGVNAGEAFLPSINELKYLYENRELINEKLALIKGADLLLRRYYLSSSEYSNGYAWLLYFGDGDVNGYGKGNYGYVCPVVAF